MNEVQVLNKFKAPGNLPQGLSGIEAAEYAIFLSKEEKKIYCIDLRQALVDGNINNSTVLSVKLRDENGVAVTAKPLGITLAVRAYSDWWGNTRDLWGGEKWWDYANSFYISFDDRKIRRYSQAGLEPLTVYGSTYVYTTTDIPDGLSILNITGESTRSLYYCASSTNKIYRIVIATGQEIDLGVVYNADGLTEYSGFNPLDLSFWTWDTNPDTARIYMCSGNLKKLEKFQYTGGKVQADGDTSFQYTTSTPFTSISSRQYYWPTLSIVEKNELFYFAATDGNVYQVRLTPDVAWTPVTVKDQFTTGVTVRGFLGGLKIPYIKIAGQTKDGYLKKTGTTYTTSVASTPTVTINGESAVKYVGTRLTGGNYEIYRSYLSFDTEFIDFQPGVVHLYLKTVSMTTQDMELLVYEMPAHNVLTADKWGQVGRLLATKHICAYHSIYLPLDVDLTNGLYVEIRGSQEATNSYIQNDLVTISAYESRIFS